MSTRPPLPPFTHETAVLKVRLAEDGWNSRDPEKVALAYTPNCRWRNRSEFVNGRQEIVAFLTRKWAKELDYRLIKELWAFTGNRIAVRFAYEWHDDSGNWFRSFGNENWEFDDDGLMRLRLANINDLPIRESERKYHWPLGRRPDDHPGLPITAFSPTLLPAALTQKPGSFYVSSEALVRQRWNASRGRLARKARPYVNLQVAGFGSDSSCDAQFGGR